ncbi:MAG: hypothetical protein JWO73_547 [Candidatus Taylorbacteria bacterium]|nr:hypothetical protein [Candidatus Taylorbacteria bacterium]
MRDKTHEGFCFVFKLLLPVAASFRYFIVQVALYLNYIVKSIASLE